MLVNLIKKCSILLLLFVGTLNAHCIVFVHIGPSIPPHLFHTFAQARQFNNCPIYLIANQICLETISAELTAQNITFVSCESLTPSINHQNFSKGTMNSKGTRFDAFWVYTSERFFYLQEFVSQHNLNDVFHLEGDVMLYVDLEELLPIFKKRYDGMIGATFENDNRCCAAFMYISIPDPLNLLVEFYPKRTSVVESDMEALANFKKKYHKIYIDDLPIVLPEYAIDHPLTFYNPTLFYIETSNQPKSFSNNFDDFNAIFDAAAWGVYLAGWDSYWHEESFPGMISQYCIFKPSLFGFHWEVDEKGRLIPFVTYKNKSMRIYNLHITNKIKIPDFFS
jgi:hypothetical protein